MKILIAEDEYTTRLMVHVSLEKWGYKVESVADGKEALAALNTKDAPQIAILDWEMPEISGLDVCKKIKKEERENGIYVILLTGRDSQNDILQGFDAGTDDYMTKPFNDDELRARVKVAERIVRIQSTLARSVEELKHALNLVDALQGSVAVCEDCHRIEGEDSQWYQLAEYLKDQYDSRFITSLCPDCNNKK